MVDETAEVEEKGVEPNPEFICIKKCYVKGRLLDVGDKIRLTGKEKFIKFFKEAKKDVPVVEKEEDKEPETLAEIAKLEAEKTLNDLNPGTEVPSGEGPVEEVPVSKGADTLLA